MHAHGRRIAADEPQVVMSPHLSLAGSPSVSYLPLYLTNFLVHNNLDFGQMGSCSGWRRAGAYCSGQWLMGQTAVVPLLRKLAERRHQPSALDQIVYFNCLDLYHT